MNDLNTVPNTGTFGEAIGKVNTNFMALVQAIRELEYQTRDSKGIYVSVDDLPTNSKQGDWAFVLGTGGTFPATLYTHNGTAWSATSQTWTPASTIEQHFATAELLNDTSIVHEVKPDSTGLVTSGAVANELYGGNKLLSPVDTHSGYVYNGNVSGTAKGYWTTSSGWNSKIYDVTELAGKTLTVLGAKRSQSYSYIFCRDYTLIPANSTAFNNDATGWTENKITVLSARGANGNVLYSNSALQVPAVPSGASHVYLIIAGYTGLPASATTYVAGALERKQDLLVFDDTPIEDSVKPVKSGGILLAINEAMNTSKYGETALVSKMTGKYLYGSKDATEIYWASDSSYSTYIFDVTNYAGKSVTVYQTNHNNNNVYKVLSDIIPSSYNSSSNKYDISEKQLAHYTAGNVSTAVAKNSRTIALTSSVITEHVNNGGSLYLYVCLHNNYEQADLRKTLGWSNGKQDALTFDDDPMKDSDNPVKSGGVFGMVAPLRDILNGTDCLVKVLKGKRLYGSKTSTSVKFETETGATYGTFNCYIFDVTAFVGSSVSFFYSKRSNSSDYKLVKDWTVIGTSSTDISDVLLSGGSANTSNVSASSSNKFSTEINLTSAAVVEQAQVGKVYLIVNLRNDYEQKSIKSTAGMGERLDELEGKGQIWVEEEKNRIVSLLKKKLGHEILIIGFNTDQHIRQSSRETYTDPVLRGLNALRKMAAEVPFSLICLGGDAAGYGSETTQARVDADVMDVINAVDTDKCPVVCMTGNHDAGQNVGWSNVDGINMYNTSLKRNVVRRQLDGFRYRSTNCYIDDAAQQIRYIFLDPWARAEGMSSGDGKKIRVMSSLLTEALADDKLVDNEQHWGVIIFSHNVIPAGVSGNSYDAISASTDIWTNIIKPRMTAGVKILACFNGHGHRDTQGVLDGINFIQTQNAQSREVSDTNSFDGKKHTKTVGTEKETSFDVFVIDQTDSKIYAYRYGAGPDRVFHFGQTAGISLCVLTGTVTVDGVVATGTITASYHNVVYSATLDENGGYAFNFLCPECDWELTFALDEEEYTYTYAAVEGEQTYDIEITTSS